MVKLFEAGVGDIWKDSSSPEIKAIGYSLMRAVARLVEAAAGTNCYANIDSLSEEALDYFAVELRVMYYSQDFDIETKRELIKNALPWYMKAGTVSAVEEMIQVIFGEGYSIEWWDFVESEGDKIPYTFDIVAETDIVDPTEYMQIFEEILSRVKNVRSHMRGVMFLRIVDTQLRAAVLPQSFPVIWIPNDINREYDLQQKESVAGVVDSWPTVTIHNMVNIEASAIQRQSFSGHPEGFTEVTILQS